MKLIELHKVLVEEYGLYTLDIEDYNDGWHDSVRDWIANSVFVNQDDLSPNQFKEIEKILVEYETNN